MLRLGYTLLLVVAGSFLFGGLIGLVIKDTLIRSEKIECQKLERYAEEYRAFYLTKWQKQMCDTHKVFIKAEVK